MRGEFVEHIAPVTDYKKWQHVGKLNNNKFPHVDFQRGNEFVQLTTHDAKSLAGLQKKLGKLENWQPRTPTRSPCWT